MPNTPNRHSSASFGAEATSRGKVPIPRMLVDGRRRNWVDILIKLVTQINKVIPDQARHALRHTCHYAIRRLDSRDFPLLKTGNIFHSLAQNKADLTERLWHELTKQSHGIMQNILPYTCTKSHIKNQNLPSSTINKCNMLADCTWNANTT